MSEKIQNDIKGSLFDCLFFKTGFLYVALAVLKHFYIDYVGLELMEISGLCLLSAESYVLPCPVKIVSCIVLVYIKFTSEAHLD